MPEPENCPNCYRDLTTASRPADTCVLEALMACLQDRGEHTDATLATIWRDTDTDAFWSDVGDLLDKLGRGGYSVHGE